MHTLDGDAVEGHEQSLLHSVPSEYLEVELLLQLLHDCSVSHTNGVHHLCFSTGQILVDFCLVTLQLPKSAKRSIIHNLYLQSVCNDWIRKLLYIHGCHTSSVIYYKLMINP